mgnify:CR=1 FL=1
MDAERNRIGYIEGTAARKLAVVPEYEQRPKKAEEKKRAVAPELSHSISLFSMIVFAVAMVIALYMCYDYLQIRGNIEQLEREVGTLQTEADKLIAANDAFEETLATNFDWEQVYATAIGELGMVYPNKNEKITYTSAEKGHVIVYRDIPD